MSPVCTEYARSFRKTIWAAVCLAECRCFCCAKMARGAVGALSCCKVSYRCVSLVCDSAYANKNENAFTNERVR